MKGNPSIEAIGLPDYIRSLGLNYEEFEAIMENPAILAKISTIARWSDRSYPTAVKWVRIYNKKKKEQLTDGK